MRRNSIATKLISDIVSVLNESLFTTYSLYVLHADDTRILIGMDSLTSSSENLITIQWNTNGICISCVPAFRNTYGWDSIHDKSLYWWLDVLSRAFYKVSKLK